MWDVNDCRNVFSCRPSKHVSLGNLDVKQVSDPGQPPPQRLLDGTKGKASRLDVPLLVLACIVWADEMNNEGEVSCVGGSRLVTICPFSLSPSTFPN